MSAPGRPCVDCGAPVRDLDSYRLCDLCAAARVRDHLPLSDWPRAKLGQCAVCGATPVVRAFPLPLCAAHAVSDLDL
jgi:hypothetical protein